MSAASTGGEVLCSLWLSATHDIQPVVGVDVAVKEAFPDVHQGILMRTKFPG